MNGLYREIPSNENDSDSKGIVEAPKHFKVDTAEMKTVSPNT